MLYVMLKYLTLYEVLVLVFVLPKSLVYINVDLQRRINENLTTFMINIYCNKRFCVTFELNKFAIKLYC